MGERCPAMGERMDCGCDNHPIDITWFKNVLNGMNNEVCSLPWRVPTKRTVCHVETPSSPAPQSPESSHSSGDLFRPEHVHQPNVAVCGPNLNSSAYVMVTDKFCIPP